MQLVFRNIDLNCLGLCFEQGTHRPVLFSTEGWTDFSIQVVLRMGTNVTTVLEAKRRNAPGAEGQSFASALVFSAADVWFVEQAVVDSSFVGLEVTTPEGSDAFADVFVNLLRKD